MLFTKEIEDLHDDGFQGSTNDRRIFSEVFFGNDHDRTSKRCLVTGAINFDCDYSRQADKFCSNSEISAITSKVDSCNVNEDSREYSALLMLKDHLSNGKRIKLSDDDLSYCRPYSEAVLNSSTSLDRVVSGMSQPDSKFVCHSVTCHIVESSSHSVTSSCYLLRRPAETSSRSNMGGRNVSKCGLWSLDGTDKKEGSASKAIASPISQESFATKILVTSPPAGIANKSSNIHKAAKAKISSSKAFKKDPSPLLRSHMQSLLRAAGWEIGSRKRLDRTNGCKWTYLSPQGGKPIHEFYKAWNLCGQSLLASRSVVVEKEGKPWASVAELWSDLSLTLSKIEGDYINTETTAALAHQWCLLDPFADMVLIEKKWGRLRAGEVVMAKRMILLDTPAKDDGILSLKDVDSIGNQCERHSLDCIHGSSLVSESMLTNLVRNYPGSNGYCGHKISENFGHSHKGAVTAKGVPIHLRAEKCTEFRDIGSGIGARRREISGDKKTGQDLNSLQASGADGTHDHCNSWLFDVPIPAGTLDFKFGGSDSVSPHQDSGTSSPGGDRHRSEHDEAMASEVDESVSMGSSGGGGFCRKVNHSGLNCRNEDVSQFNDQDSHVEDSHFVVSYDTEFMQHAGFGGKAHGQSIDVSRFEMSSVPFAADAVVKRKEVEKSKKISKSKLATLHRNERLILSTNKAEGLKIDDSSIQSQSREVWEYLIATNARSARSCKKSGLRKVRCSTKKLKKFSHYNAGEASRQDMKSEDPETRNQAGSTSFQLKDDDLLISAVLKTKTFKSTTKHSTTSKKFNKPKSLRKNKRQKGRCRLLPRSMVKGGKHMEGKWPIIGVRTVLSWLTELGVISLNEVIQYRDPKDEYVVKDGLVTRDGIFCKCCNRTVSVSEFKSHAGFRLSRPCVNLVMESGKPFTLCQLEAWSMEYTARKNATQAVQVEEVDQNDDSCGLCGNGGELICCDNCPSTFHQSCLYVKELPEGDWYCSNCTCRICGDVVHDKEASQSPDALKCSQCENKYHEDCLKGTGLCKQVASNTWFCGESCQEVYLGLQSHIGFVNLLSDGFSWTLLRCIYGDQKVHSAQRFVALKAECNSKLAVALKIMEECFLPMVDPRTGIDMIPHVVYNWGSEFARLNYHGFYTMVLEKDDVLMSVASIRIHGVTVAEMPLIATCSLYRRQGMCRRLMNSIEEMLKSLEVEKLVISAIPSLVETWTLGFGFQPLEDGERRSLSSINLMVFPGTVWLKKPIFKNQETSQWGGGGSGHAAPLSSDDPTATAACPEGGPAGDIARQPDRSPPLVGDATQIATRHYFTSQSDGSPSEEDAARTATGHTGGTKIQVEEVQDHNWTGHFSNLSCEEPDRTAGGSQLEIGCGTEAVVTYDDIQVEKGHEDNRTDYFSELSCEELDRTAGGSQIEIGCGTESVVMHGDIQVEKGQKDNWTAHFSKLSCKEPDRTAGGSQLEVGCAAESVVTYGDIQVEKGQEYNWTDHLSKLAFEEPDRMAEGSQNEIVCGVESVITYDKKELRLDERLQISQHEIVCGVESLVMSDKKELALDEQLHEAGMLQNNDK